MWLNSTVILDRDEFFHVSLHKLLFGLLDGLAASHYEHLSTVLMDRTKHSLVLWHCQSGLIPCVVIDAGPLATVSDRTVRAQAHLDSLVLGDYRLLLELVSHSSDTTLRGSDPLGQGFCRATPRS